MRIGVPKEIKSDEDRVALTPAGCMALVQDGHSVLLQAGAGAGSGFADDDYRLVGGTVVDAAHDVWESSELVVKVKEPLPAEYMYFRPSLTLFTYLHLAAEPRLVDALTSSGITAIAYETVQRPDGALPLLMPMSEIAGRMAVQVGAQCLEKPHGGKGLLLGGVPGVLPGRVVVLGAGIAGQNAVGVAMGLGAEVTAVDINTDRLRDLDNRYRGRLHTLASNPYYLAQTLGEADLVVSAVLVPGARAPRVVTSAMVRQMRPGSVIVDVAIDQGGSVETIDRATTHSDPTYVKFGVVHYAVANIPGAVARTSTLALTNATLSYIRLLAGQGVDEALRQDASLGAGLNVRGGAVTHQAVAAALDWPAAAH